MDASILRPGDLMLYRPKGLVGWLIASRTFSNWAHVEVYDGDGYALASRDGIGVGRYPIRLDRLGKVARPIKPINLDAMRAWFPTVDGQKYDLWAIARFVLPHIIKRDVDLSRQICSAFAVRLYRAGGFDPVAPDADADLVAPSTLAVSPAFAVIWTDGGI